MAILRTEPRFSVLSFIEQSKHYDHNAPYNTGRVTHMLNVPLGIIPPFQIIKTDDNDWATIELVNYSTGTATDVKAAMELTGLVETEYDGTGDIGDYNLWEYPGTVALPVTVSEGAHYLRLQDTNGNYALSEMFVFIDGLELRKDYVKVEWWSLEDMILDCEYIGGVQKSTAHIRFNAPFKWWIYVKSHLVFHGWKYEEENEVRNGIEYVKKITSFKEYSFKFAAPEYLVDAISKIPLHDKKQVTYLGKTYDRIWRFMPDATPSGTLYGVEVVFQANQTTNTVSGVGYTDTTYETASGGCLDVIRSVWMDSSTPEYTAAEYLSPIGALLNLEAGDYVVAVVLGTNRLRQWNGATYNVISPVDYTNYFCQHDARLTGVNATAGEFYFFALSNLLFDTPIRSSETPGTPWHVDGDTFGNSLLQVILKDGSGDEWTGATVTSDQFNTSGVDFLIIDNGRIATAYKLRAATWACPNLAESEWFPLEGVDYDIIADTLVVYPDEGVPDPDDPDG